MSAQRLGAKSIVLMLLMFVSAAVGYTARPTTKIADQKSAIKLEAMIPETFGGWRELKQSTSMIVNPQEQQMLNELYSQTLSKSYVNDDGYRVMLSIAYGGDQSRDLQVHRPEVCYAAQGFQVYDSEKVSLNIKGGQLPVMRLQARLGTRTEPVTYWVRIGDKIVRGNLEQGFARLSYGVKGQIADGLLFRVSSIDKEAARAYQYQEQFVNDLMLAVAETNKPALWGKFKPGTASP